MSEHRMERLACGEWPVSRPARPDSLDRRTWLRLAAVAVAFPDGRVQAVRVRPPAPDPKADEAEEMRLAEARARGATTRPLLTLKSAHYQAIGDASERFIKVTLADCERMAADYIAHFRSRGFDVNLPARRLTLIVLRDERPFQKFAGKTPPGTAGFYSRSDNWLSLFDFRNMPMHPFAAGQSNMETITHEATHQLSFNSGLLRRETDIPRSITEGLAMYCERRRLYGRSEPGQLNLRRLEELAHFRRREPWIRAEELLVDDRACWGRTSDRLMLSYSESWLMVYHLMSDRDRLPQFRAYLDALRKRNDATRRLEDARQHFGDLARLDEEMRQEAIRLQRAL